MDYFYLSCSLLIITGRLTLIKAEEIEPVPRPGPYDDYSEYNEYLRKLKKQWETVTVPNYVEIVTYVRPSRNGWDVVRRGEISYYGAIYTVKNNESSFDPGKTCGCIAIASARVMTSCACVMSWLEWIKNGMKALKKSSYATKYDLFSKDIYASLNGNSFKSNQKHKLKNDIVQSIMSSQMCTPSPGSKAFMYELLSKPAILDLEKKVWLRGQLSLANLPIVVQSISVDKLLYLYSFNCKPRKDGQKFFNEIRQEIDMQKSACSVAFRLCENKNCAPLKDNNVKAEDWSLLCLCGPKPKQIDVCGGLIGSPISTGEGLFGVAISELECSNKDSVTIMFAGFNEDTMDNIAKYFDKASMSSSLQLDDDYLYPSYDILGSTRKKRGNLAQLTSPWFGFVFVSCFIVWSNMLTVFYY